jgi:NAD(P)H-dependent FMN reductase
MSVIRVLGLSGSLRRASLNSLALSAAVDLAPPGVVVDPFRGLGDLPLYNQDFDWDHPPTPVVDLRRRVGQSDGLLICTPEYAHGIAGPMKNALDWLVASEELPGMPVALVATSDRAVHAPAHLREVLRTMSARIVEEASVTLPLLGRGCLDVASFLADRELADPLRRALERFATEIGRL